MAFRHLHWSFLPLQLSRLSRLSRSYHRVTSGQWSALAVTGLVLLAVPNLGWQYQFLTFSGLSVISMAAFRRYQRTSPAVTDQPNLSRCGEQKVVGVRTFPGRKSNSQLRSGIMPELSTAIPYPGHLMRAFILFLLSSLLLTSCAAVDDSKKSITLDKALWQYETAIRWVDFSSANSLRRPEGDAQLAPDPEVLKHIKVTSYNVLNSTTSEDHAEVNMTVEIIYYHDERMKLSTLTDKQTWKYDPAVKAWYITTPLPAFK